jgi:hypothetical protein
MSVNVLHGFADTDMLTYRRATLFGRDGFFD